jgi:diaminopropionate ammonia-lyase
MARFLRNPHIGPILNDGPTRAPLEYHRRLPGYSPTPLVDSFQIADDLGLDGLYVKDESSRLGLPSFKILGASWGVYRALEEHVGGIEQWETLDELAEQLESHKPLALATATDGNHGRAVACMARLLRLDARVFVPSGTARARIEAIEGEGARCDVVDGTYDDAVARSAEEASDRCLVISDTSWPGYEQVPLWIIEGYSTIFWEVDDVLSNRGRPVPDLVVVQIGVGALAAAAVRHYRRLEEADRPVLVGVEPERAACVFASAEAGEIVTVPGPHDSIMAGLNCGTPSLVAWPYVSKGFDAFAVIEDERAIEAMAAFADVGVVAGETGAAGLGCLVELLRRNRELELGSFRRPLLLCTEGATDPAGYERVVGRAPESVEAGR